jgi:hypothetical protein
VYSHVNKVLKFGGGGRWGVQSPLIRVPRDEQLRSLWGSVQLGWYGTDVDGRIVCRMLVTGLAVTSCTAAWCFNQGLLAGLL